MGKTSYEGSGRRVQLCPRRVSSGCPQAGSSDSRFSVSPPIQHCLLWGGSFSVAFWMLPCPVLSCGLPSLLPAASPRGPPAPWAATWSWDHTRMEPASWKIRAPGWTLWLLLSVPPPLPPYFSGLCFPSLLSQQLPSGFKTASTHRAGFQEAVSLSWILEC